MQPTSKAASRKRWSRGSTGEGCSDWIDREAGAGVLAGIEWWVGWSVVRIRCDRQSAWQTTLALVDREEAVRHTDNED